MSTHSAKNLPTSTDADNAQQHRFEHHIQPIVMPKCELPLDLHYGPGFASEHMEARFKSIWTMQYDEKSHHCGEPGCGEMKMSCYAKLHEAFCCVVIEMPGGLLRFCGFRFAVQSPHGCVKHPMSSYPENRFFQLAKKNLPYELPTFYPHLVPGWNISMPGFGVSGSEATIIMGKDGDKLCFFRADRPSQPGMSDRLYKVVNVPKKDLRIARIEVASLGSKDEIEDENAVAPVQKPAEIQAIANLEQTDVAAYDNSHSYMSYNDAYNDIKEQSRIKFKDARKARAAEVAANSKSKKPKEAEDKEALKKRKLKKK
jgi:hypothetical protein